LEITINSKSTGFDMRASAILEFKEEQWKMIHWHVSKPYHVQSETDTYGIEEWKQKADALEKLVAERTADLLEKNDELKAAITELNPRNLNLSSPKKWLHV
jgi:C4-dicarboxylate-specific signal transduction histidine kinase